MTKMESLLAQICSFAGENVMLHLESACVITLRLQCHDFYEKECTLWWSLLISAHLLICWSDALDRARVVRISINIQLPHCFCCSLLLNLGFLYLNLQCKNFWSLERKSCRDESDLFELNFSWVNQLLFSF